jgi:hypothetical protein
MNKNGKHKMTRSFLLWAIGSAVFLIACIVILNNFTEANLSPDERASSTGKPQTKLTDRNSSQAQTLSRAHHPSSNNSGGVTANEEMISQIVGSGRPIHDIAKELLEILPESKGSEQTLVASHLGHLADEEQLDELVSYLSDPRMNQRSKEEIFNAIYDSEPKQAASLLIKVIENGVQEFSSEAEKGLSILLQADHGMDVAGWKSELNRPGNFLESEE